MRKASGSKRSWWVGAIALGAVAAAGITATAVSWGAPTEIDGKVWTLIQEKEPEPGDEITLVIGGSGISGNDGCNDYWGEARVGAVGPLGTGIEMNDRGWMGTLVACLGQEGREFAYLQALKRARWFAVEGGRLRLRDVSGEVLLQYRPSVRELAPSAWSMRVYTVPRLGLASLAGPEMTLVFELGGRLHGNTGCNDYTGAYRVDGEKLWISELQVGRAECPGERVMLREESLLNSLREAAAFDRLESRLRLLSSGGTEVALLFIRKTPEK